jgi:hypothetical protein
MSLSARRWKQLTESRYAHEREALEFLRDALPDRDPIFVYSNFDRPPVAQTPGYKAPLASKTSTIARRVVWIGRWCVPSQLNLSG